MLQVFSLPAVRRNNPLKETWRGHGERTLSEWTSELAQSKPSLICCNHTINIFPHRTLKPNGSGDTSHSTHCVRARVPMQSQMVYKVRPTWNVRAKSSWVSALSHTWKGFKSHFCPQQCVQVLFPLMICQPDSACIWSLSVRWRSSACAWIHTGGN